MSIEAEPAGDAENIPSFLLRGPMREAEAVQAETAPFPILRSSILLSGGIAGAMAALSFGGYLMIADGKQEPNASEAHAIAAPAVTIEAPVVAAKPEPALAVQPEARPQTQAPAVQTEAAPETSADAPRQVTTTHVDADPSVWTNVRKFTPLPANQVSVLEGEQAAPLPAAAPISEETSKERAPRTEKHRHHARTSVKHAHSRHADRRRGLAAFAQQRSPHARTTADGAPSDEGGTTMTAEQLRRDGSANPVVNAFAGMFGPK